MRIVKPVYRYILLLITAVFLSVAGMSQCKIQSDFNDYHVNGMSSTIQWNVSSSHSVVCSSSDWQPSFFVNSDSLLNVRISGDIVFTPEMNDDDFVGFVFGYKAPIGHDFSNLNHYYLFDWRKNYQEAPEEFGGFPAREGFNLSYIDGVLPFDPVSTYHSFWGHFMSENFYPIEHLYGNDLGWNINTTYHFELIYTHNRIIISIDGNEIFDVEGRYEPGLFGLYSFNQNGVIYENVVYEQYYKIELSDNHICKDVEMGFHFSDTNTLTPPPSLAAFEWSFGDDTNNSTDLFPRHTYYEAGGKDIELYITNTNDCIDTVKRRVFVEPNPVITFDPVDTECIVGDNVEFSIRAQNVESFQWYYQEVNANEWIKLRDNDQYSGVETRVLTVINVRPYHQGMKYKCYVQGYCGTLLNSNQAELIIVDNPARALLDLTDNSICVSDTTTLNLTIKEIYLLQSAKMDIEYDAENVEIVDYETHLRNSVDVSFNDDIISVDYHTVAPMISDELVLVSFTLISRSQESIHHDFKFDDEQMYFINLEGDTINHLLYDTQLAVNEPILLGFNDTIKICEGSRLEVDEQLFNAYHWSTGEQTAGIRIYNEGMYWLNTTDTNFCQSVDSFYLIPITSPSPPESINLSQTFYCSYDDEIDLSVERAGNETIELAYLNETIIDSSDFHYTIDNPGYDFEIFTTASNQCGKSATLTTLVKVYPEVVPTVSIIRDSNHKADIHLGEMVKFEAAFEGGGEHPYFTWWIDDMVKQNGSDDVFITNELKAIQKIKLELYSDAKCLLNDNYALSELEIRLDNADEVFVPTIITPNGKSNNDAFKVIFRDNNVYDFSLRIYNIRGQLVFATNDRYEYWSGADVQNASTGLYTYLIEYSLVLRPIGDQLKVLKGKFLLHK